MSGEAQTLEKPAESIASDFVASLGLTEIVLGSLALYCHYLSAKGAAAAALPPTGHEVVDIALLVCAASLVGKILTLIIALLMAPANRALRLLKYAKELRPALANYWSVFGLSGGPPGRRQLETAIAAIRSESPAKGKILDSIRNHVVIAYGAALLGFLYAGPLSSVLSPHSSTRPVHLAASALLLLGLLQQADLFGQVIAFLNVARPDKSEDQNA